MVIIDVTNVFLIYLKYNFKMLQKAQLPIVIHW